MTIREMPLGGNVSVEVFTTIRRNIAMNPRGKTSATSWGGAAGSGGVSSLVRRGDTTPVGTGNFRVTVTTAGTWFRGVQVLPNGTVEAGKTYTLSMWLRASPAATNGRLLIIWKSSSGATIIESSTPNLDLTGTWARYSLTAVAPPNSRSAQLQFGRVSGAVGDFVDATGVLFERSAEVGTYFDGDSSSTNEYEGGTETSTSLLRGWLPLLDDATQLNIQRGGVLDGVAVKTDVGLATFTLKNAEDPMNGGRLLPGQDVRIRDVSPKVLYTQTFSKSTGGWTAGLGSVSWVSSGIPSQTLLAVGNPNRAERVFTGLVVGRTYTFSASARVGSSSTVVGRLGVLGGTETSFTTVAQRFVKGEHVFTATATSHTLYMSVDGNSAYWDDVSLTEPKSVPIFTGRIADLSTVYPLDKSNGTSRALTQVTVADAVKVHVATTRYGITSTTGFETFEGRISRLSSTAQAPMDVPTVGAPRTVYSF